MTKHQQYNQYLDFGGTLTFQEWINDSRYDQWIAGHEGLIDAVLDWWAEHKDDVDESPTTFGTIESERRYDEPPKFVKIAMALKEQTKSE
jgi:hypothetical protein